MAGSSPVDLEVAVAEAGGMGAMGALLSSPETISDWAALYRLRSGYAINNREEIDRLSGPPKPSILS